MPRNNLPSVTSSDVPRDLRAWIDRVGESLSKLSDAATISELAKAGVITVGPGGEVTGPGGDDDGGDVFIPVLTPPAPEGFQVTGGYEYIIVEWDAPEYYGHSYTAIYRNTTPDFPTGQIPVAAYGNVYSDYVGNANVVYDEEGNVTGYETFYYWIAFVNINDVQGPEVGPESAQTAINVDEVITALAGKLTSTAFVDDLSTFLDNAPDNYVVKLGAGGVAAGFGLANTGSDTDPEFDFAVLANSFFIAPPVKFNQDARPTSGVIIGDVWRLPAGANTNDTPYAKYYVATVNNPTVIGQWKEINPAPFIVRTTDATITNADGEQTFVPAGVYITDAYIQDGTIARAKIGTAAIDNAKIANAAISAAKVAYLDARNIVTGTLRSPNFTNEAGKAGFLLTMTESGTVFIPTLDADGEFQFNSDGTIVGTYDGSFNQEDVTFILRGANDEYPALQLLDGEITINALNIRDKLQSVSYEEGGTYGFSIDLGNPENNTSGGFVDFRDAIGESVFQISNSFTGGVVKMTGAAIRDFIQSYNYSDQRAGFYLHTGIDFFGRSNDDLISFYLRGKNGKILFAVDGDTETLAEEIKNSNVTTSNLAGSVNQNPLLTEINFKTNLPRPRNYFVASTPYSDTLSYVDDTYSIARLRQPRSVTNVTFDQTVNLCSSAIRVDDSVKRYKIIVRWKANRTDPNPGGLSFWCTGTTADTLDEGKVALSHFTNSETEVQYAGSFSNAVAPVTVLSDSNMIVTTNYALVSSGTFPEAYVLRDDVRDANGNLYPNYNFKSVYDYTGRVIRNTSWNTTELLVAPEKNGNRFKWMSFNINMGDDCPIGLELEIDQIVISPYELKGEKILDNNGDPLGIFAWVQEKITQNNITTYFDNLAVTEAVIGRAAVKTLKIGENAVTVPTTLNVATGNYVLNNTETMVSSANKVSIQYAPVGSDPDLLPSSITAIVTVELGSSGLGGDWAAAVVRLRSGTGTVNATIANLPQVEEALQQNGRKGAPPSLVFSCDIEPYFGTRTYALSLQVRGEQGSASDWWRVVGGSVIFLATKR